MPGIKPDWAVDYTKLPNFIVETGRFLIDHTILRLETRVVTARQGFRSLLVSEALRFDLRAKTPGRRWELDRQDYAGKVRLATPRYGHRPIHRTSLSHLRMKDCIRVADGLHDARWRHKNDQLVKNFCCSLQTIYIR